eukprot:m.83849 g.83849  ORF g.83849 m.83849 type:complete len:519 (-) comp8176_c0_seq2:133-1689(-)
MRRSGSLTSFAPPQRGPSKSKVKKTIRSPCSLSFAVAAISLVVFLLLVRELLATRSGYAVVIDCGSSGSRVFVYKVSCDPRRAHETLPTAEQVLDDLGRSVVKKSEPGISQVQPAVAVAMLRELLHFAEKHIPAHLHASTHVFIHATAGLRLLPAEDQSAILTALRTELPDSTTLPIHPDKITIISGALEGVYAWVAVNYATGAGAIPWSPDDHSIHTAGCLDMGGASAQVAYEIGSQAHGIDEDHIVVVDLGDGVIRPFTPGPPTERHHRVYVVTLPGEGANEARARYERRLSPSSSRRFKAQAANGTQIIGDPCLPPGLEINSSQTSMVLAGLGDFHRCSVAVRAMLDCDGRGCNGINLPLPPPHLTWYGFSEYWYTHFDVYALEGHYDPARFETHSMQYCRTPWNVTLADYRAGRLPNARMTRLRNQCFKAAWVSAMLHIRHRLPRTADLRIANTIAGQDVQWTLGVAVLQGQMQCSRLPRPTLYAALLSLAVLALLAARECLSFRAGGPIILPI